MALFLLEIVAVFYLLAALSGTVQLLWPRESGSRVILLGLVVTVIAHGFALGSRTSEVGGFPVANLHDGLSVLGFLVGLLALGLAWRAGIPQAGPVACWLVSALLLVSVIVQPADRLPPHLRSPWLPIHIATAFLAYAAFVLAGILALIYLIQERRLKTKRRLALVGTGLHKLPSLEVLDRVSVGLVQAGFPLMTIGLACGSIYSKQILGVYWSWDLLNIVSVLVWFLNGVLLHFRLTIGWRGRKAAALTLLGLSLTLLTFVTLGLLGVGAHAKDYAS